MNLVSIGTIAGVVLVALIVLGLILTRLYRRASKEVSFVQYRFRWRKSHHERRCDGTARVTRNHPRPT